MASTLRFERLAAWLPSPTVLYRALIPTDRSDYGFNPAASTSVIFSEELGLYQ